MEWRSAPVVSKGVWERPFTVDRAGEQLPGIVWMPEEPSGPVPLVLIGHGGKSHKRNPTDLAIARRCDLPDIATWIVGLSPQVISTVTAFAGSQPVTMVDFGGIARPF